MHKQIFVCSDPHFWHANIMKHCARTHFMTERDRELYAAGTVDDDLMRRFRPCNDSVYTMNQGLVANINARVPRDATLWCLGDWGMKPKRHQEKNEYYSRSRAIRDQIACQDIHFIWGNHDDRIICDLFTKTYDQVQVRFDNVQVTFNHYPLVSWNGQYHGSIESPNVCLYGHVHNKDATPKLLVDGGSWAALDVGFDSNEYQVWTLQEAIDYLSPRLEALGQLKREKRQFDPFRGRSEDRVSKCDVHGIFDETVF